MGLFDSVGSIATAIDPVNGSIYNGVKGMSGGGSLVSSILDPIFGTDTSSEDAAALAALKAAQEAYGGLQGPDLSVVTPEAYKSAGTYSPSLISAALQGDSAYSDIEVDPRLMNDQMEAIQALRDVAAAGGLTAADKANLANIQSTEAQADRGRREAIIQDMNARGMGSSGNNLLAQLTSSQAATDRQSQQDLGIAGQAQQNALNATLNAGNLANTVGNNQFNQKAQVAAAQDAINKFNAQQLASSNTANAAARNDASQYNLNNAQQLSNANTLAKNTAAQQRAYDLPQQQYQNQLSKAAGISGQAKNLSDYYTGLGDRETAKNAGYMSAILGGAGIAAKGMS